MRGRRLEKTGSVFAEYVEDCYGPRTRPMQADRSSQQNGMTRTDSSPGLFITARSVVRSSRPAGLLPLDRPAVGFSEQQIGECSRSVHEQCGREHALAPYEA